MLDHLSSFIDKLDLSAEELGLWYASVANYSFWAKRFHHDHDPSKIVGQDNFFKYKTLHGIVLRITKEAKPLDIYRSCAAALSSDTPIQISFTQGQTQVPINDQWKHLFPHFKIKEESESQFLERIRLGAFKRIRLLSTPSKDLFVSAADSMTHVAHAPVLASGRFELLHYLHEIAISIDYHRYGNLGVREGELRKPIQ
jgi:RHH-type proline utilization regulon transcriptional repressor/proline dehydrogenase/delta 1-pyrroline-5-carboxylate dehydrogenase